MAIGTHRIDIFKKNLSLLSSEETKIVVVSPQYAADIDVIMSTTDKGSLNNYLVLSVATDSEVYAILIKDLH